MATTIASDDLQKAPSFQLWWEKQSAFKEKKAVVKLYNEDGSLSTSVNIPSIYWPLNGPYEVFHFKNTEYIGEVPKIAELFDKQSYQIGHCYSNTENIVQAFRESSFDVQPYCGWLFLENEMPIHHCWAVITFGIGFRSILDLSCDNFRLRQYILEKAESDPEGFKKTSAKEDIVRFIEYALRELSHTERCYPLGVAPPGHLYIGSPCEPEEGVRIYQKMVQMYPDHLSIRNVNAQGYNKTQWLLKQQGLMD